MQFPAIPLNHSFSSSVFTRRELGRLGALVLATTLGAVLFIPLERASIPPADISAPMGFRQRLDLELALNRHVNAVGALSKKEKERQAVLTRQAANQFADSVNQGFTALQSKWSEQRSTADRAAWWLLLARCAWAGVLALAFVILPVVRRSATGAVIVPAIVIAVTICWSSESGARVATALAITWAVIACVAKAIHDNLALRYKRPSWPKVGLGFLAVLPALLVLIGVCYSLGNQLEQYLARKVFETEAVLMLGVDAANQELDEMMGLKGSWWDPWEWLFYSSVRHFADNYGRPAVARTASGISLSYAALRSVYRVLQYLSALGFAVILLRATLFAACRSFLYGGGAFMFTLPATPADGPIA